MSSEDREAKTSEKAKISHGGKRPRDKSPSNAKRKREICSHCQRPTPTACICSALPEERIILKRCHPLILQHPKESEHKNRSLPVVELCLDPGSITTVVARRFGNAVDPKAVEMLQNPETPVWLVYPDDDRAISLSQTLVQLGDETPTIVFLDATWKYAKEMDQANERTHQYPAHMTRVQLSMDDLRNLTPRRFDIRTPLSDQHLSTAECIAWVLSKVEGKPEIYDTVMKPLDLMVSQWHSFMDPNHRHAKKRKADNEAKETSAATAMVDPIKRDKPQCR